MKKFAGILLIITMLLASMGAPAFAAKPVKTASIIIESVSQYDAEAGGFQEVALVSVKDAEGDPYVAVDGSYGETEIVRFQLRNKIKYSVQYRLNSGATEVSDKVTVGVLNKAGLETTKDITVEILQPAIGNLPPEVDADPSMSGSFEVGTWVSPSFGNWTDDKGIVLIERYWELSDASTIVANDDLYLEDGFAGLEVRLVDRATDTDGAVTTAYSGWERIKKAPVNTALPTIVGSMEAGQSVQADLGQWIDEYDTNLSLNGTWNLPGGGTQTVSGELLLLDEWIGSSISLSVTATDSDGMTAAADSASYTVLEPAPVPQEINYVVLGDSIATGTIAYDYIPPEIPYPAYFKAFIEEESGLPVNVDDFSEDGDKSGDLLNKLQNDGAMREAIMDADYVTVSIGGNDLMAAAKYSFFGINYYDFDRIDTAKAETGRVNFIANFPLIVSELRTLNPDAQIFINTIYNPFNMSSDADNYDLVEGYLDKGDGSGINETILSETGYDVVDVHQAFDEGYADAKDQVTYMYIPDLILWFELRNPHPNSQGQSIIEDLHEALYRPF